MQLIQYAPTTEQVYRRPLLIVPPWINKFYILDLKPKNSFIKFAVDQGFTVFVISWANPGRSLAHKTFEDYLDEGPLAALDAIEQATGEREATVIGYCLGGTLTACMLAWMAARGDDRIKAATFFTTMTDFSEPGELAVFIDEEQLDLIEQHMQEKGYLEARHMQQVFNLMRANDLIWGFVVNNYLMGREPMAFDLLYWNADSTRMPHMMHSFYLRNMYQKNLLVQPGGIVLKGVPIDLGRIATPCYFLSTKEDHIAPWRSTYRGSLQFRGPVRFVLGRLGPHRRRDQPARLDQVRLLDQRQAPGRARGMAGDGAAHEGSWWPDWAAVAGEEEWRPGAGARARRGRVCLPWSPHREFRQGPGNRLIFQHDARARLRAGRPCGTVTRLHARARSSELHSRLRNSPSNLASVSQAHRIRKPRENRPIGG